jgi:hypothetical protein
MMDEEVNPVPASGRTGMQGREVAQPLFRQGSNPVISILRDLKSTASRGHNLQ